MRLLLDCTPFVVNRTAIGRITRDTARALESEFETRYRYVDRLYPAFELVEAERDRAARKFQRCVRHPVRFLARQHFWEWKIDASPRPRGGEPVLYFDPLYTLFHDDLDQSFVFVLDMTTLTRPDWHARGVQLLYRAAFRRIAASRCRLISISESTTADLRVNLGIHESRISTLPLYSPRFAAGTSPVSAEIRERMSRPYFLFVGSLEERKNIVGLIRAFQASGLPDRGHRLLIVGGDGKGADVIRWEAKEAQGVHLLGFVGDSELDLLYQNCVGFAYPSYWEGFGVPLLEAMARGAPCLATTTGASPEVGGDAVLYADPCDPASIAEGLRKLSSLASGEREKLVAKGRARAESFGFERYAEGLKAILRS